MKTTESGKAAGTVKSKYDGSFEPINDTPDRVAEAVLKTQPKRKDQWKYLRHAESGNSK